MSANIKANILISANQTVKTFPNETTKTTTKRRAKSLLKFARFLVPRIQRSSKDLKSGGIHKQGSCFNFRINFQHTLHNSKILKFYLKFSQFYNL